VLVQKQSHVNVLNASQPAKAGRHVIG